MSNETSTISPNACQARIARGEVIDLIDVRTPGEFASLRAAVARSVPLETIVSAFAGALQAGPPILLLCKSGARATKARSALLAAGCERDVCVVEGGTDAWVASGLPVVRDDSRCVLSLDRQVRIVAGSLVAIGAALGFLVHPYWIALSFAVGCGLVFAGVTNTCGLAMLLARLPWNRR